MRSRPHVELPSNEPAGFGRRRVCSVTRLLYIIGLTIGGWLGWWGGAQVGLTTAFILSSIGSVAGVYVGWRIHRDYLD